MRLIDADALPRFGNRGGLVHWKDIKNAPTIYIEDRLNDAYAHGWSDAEAKYHDAVSVVRCKDCKHMYRTIFCGNIYHNCGKRTEHVEDERSNMLGDLDSAPTIDAEIVKRGEWVPFDLAYGRSIWRCTACNETEEVPTRFNKALYKYCPNCGAKMEDGNNED